jgi:hypothetical protein
MLLSFALLALLAGACGGPVERQATEGEIFGGSDTTPPPGAIPTTAPPAATGPGSPTDPAPPAADRPSGNRPPTASPGGAPPPAQPSNRPDPRRARGATGSFAPVLLREDLTLELLVQSGAEPSSGALSHTRARLAEVAGREIGVSGPIALEGGAKDWEASELIALADQKAVRPPGSATMRVLYVHGTLEGNDGVLGVAVRGDVMAIFIDRVRSAGGLVGNSAGVERAVTLHEAGHLLGLVDLFLKTGRADPQHPGHSSSRQSVMYWAVESSAIGQVFGDNPPDTFDDADKADLAKIKSG